MSEVVHPDSRDIDEFKHHQTDTLPLLLCMMPGNQHQQYLQLLSPQHQQQLHLHLTVAHTPFLTQYSTYGQQDVLTLSLYHPSVNSVPASAFFPNYETPGLVHAPAPLQSMTESYFSGETLNGANSSIRGDSHGAEKCICKSNPHRIPRPRNSFILFRQRYHQSVLDEAKEAKSNQEVSRELGRRWRALSPAERGHWDNLAEEEKRNHARKYPNYRYKPRRNGKDKSCAVCNQKTKRLAAQAQEGIMRKALQEQPLAQLQIIPTQIQGYLQQQVGASQMHTQFQHVNDDWTQQQYMYRYHLMGQFGFEQTQAQTHVQDQGY